MSYGIVHQVQTPDTLLYGKLPAPGTQFSIYGGNPANLICPSLFLCCGLSSMYSFGRQHFKNFDDKAAYLEGLFNQTSPYILYAITATQATAAQEHLLFKECGAEMLKEFPNLTHGTNKIQLWLYNSHAAKGGKYLTDDGRARKEPVPEPPAAAALPDPVPVAKAPRKTTKKAIHDTDF